MENIDFIELEKILSIIQNVPMQRIGHFTDRSSSLSTLLSEICEKRDYTYLANATNVPLSMSLEESFRNIPSTKVAYFDLNKKSYLQSGLFLDYLFVTATMMDEKKDDFLKKSHKSIKNAGLILLFVDNDPSQEHTWYRLLEANYYVATNTISMHNNTNVIISKKMHGWGG